MLVRDELSLYLPSLQTLSRGVRVQSLDMLEGSSAGHMYDWTFVVKLMVSWPPCWPGERVKKKKN